MSDWRITDLFPIGNRGMDAAPEGGCKTIFGLWMASCIAAGKAFLKQSVKQGEALVIDEETPPLVLNKLADRFAQGLGFKSHSDIPLTLLSMKGFRWARKITPEIINMTQMLTPSFIRLDSYLAMLPGGRQGLGENNSDAGTAVKEALAEIMSHAQQSECNTLLSAHSGAPILGWTWAEASHHDFNDLVRGHKSVVGEACDTGFFIKKLSQYPEPLRFVVKIYPRRGAVPMAAEDIFVEVKEQDYGKGWAKLERILPIPIPPTEIAKNIFKFVAAGQSGKRTWRELTKEGTLATKKQMQEALRELVDANIIQNHREPFTYQLRPDYGKLCKPEYLRKLTQ